MGRWAILELAEICLNHYFGRIGHLGDKDAITPMLIWAFHDAPEPLKALSENGGDEDWLVAIPKHYEERIKMEPLWVTYLGACDRDFIDVSDNYLVVIGSHA